MTWINGKFYIGTGNDIDIEIPPSGYAGFNGLEVARGWYKNGVGPDLMVNGLVSPDTFGSKVHILEANDLYLAWAAGIGSSVDYIVTARSLREHGYMLTRWIDDEGAWHDA